MDCFFMFINKYLLKVPSYVDIQILHIGLWKELVSGFLVVHGGYRGSSA